MALRETLRPAIGPARAEKALATVGPTDGARFSRVLLLILLAATLDVFNFLDRGDATRYLLLLIPLGAIAWFRLVRPSMLVRRPSATDLILGSLMVFGLGGTLYGVAFLGTTETARGLFLPMFIALSPIAIIEDPTDEECGRILRWVAAIGLLYTIMNALVNSGALPNLLSFEQYRNASFPFVALGIGATVILRHRARVALMILLAGFIYATYPSATSVLVTLGTLLTLFVTRPRATSLRIIIVALGLAGLLAGALLNFTTGIAITDEYFAAVDKENANNGRLDLWTQGVERWKDSPIVGRVFSDNIVVERTRDGRELPYHNDYVLFLAEGGVVGLGLILAWMMGIEAIVLSRYRGFLRSGDMGKANLLRALLIGLNAFFISAAFNPVFPGLSRAATIFSLYALAMLVGRPEPVASTEGTGAKLNPVKTGIRDRRDEFITTEPTGRS